MNLRVPYVAFAVVAPMMFDSALPITANRGIASRQCPMFCSVPMTTVMRAR